MKKCKIVTTQIERINIVGPNTERDACYEFLHEKGFHHVVRSGPYTDAQLWPSVDVKRFFSHR